MLALVNPCGICDHLNNSSKVLRVPCERPAISSLKKSNCREKLMDEFFRKFAAKTSMVVGSSWAFLCAVLIIVVWALSGPVFGY